MSTEQTMKAHCKNMVALQLKVFKASYNCSHFPQFPFFSNLLVPSPLLLYKYKFTSLLTLRFTLTTILTLGHCFIHSFILIKSEIYNPNSLSPYNPTPRSHQKARFQSTGLPVTQSLYHKPLLSLGKTPVHILMVTIIEIPYLRR